MCCGVDHVFQRQVRLHCPAVVVSYPPQDHLKRPANKPLPPVLCTDGAMAYKSFAKEHGIKHYRNITSQGTRVIKRTYHIQNVNSYMSRLKGWMARFHGVGTAYLPSYLAWRRLFERAQPSEEAWLRIAIGANQQPMPT